MLNEILKFLSHKYYIYCSNFTVSHFETLIYIFNYVIKKGIQNREHRKYRSFEGTKSSLEIAQEFQRTF